jgi:hypothetical protein
VGVYCTGVLSAQGGRVYRVTSWACARCFHQHSHASNLLEPCRRVVSGNQCRPPRPLFPRGFTILYCAERDRVPTLKVPTLPGASFSGHHLYPSITRHISQRLLWANQRRGILTVCPPVCAGVLTVKRERNIHGNVHGILGL